MDRARVPIAQSPNRIIGLSRTSFGPGIRTRTSAGFYLVIVPFAVVMAW